MFKTLEDREIAEKDWAEYLHQHVGAEIHEVEQQLYDLIENKPELTTRWLTQVNVKQQKLEELKNWKKSLLAQSTCSDGEVPF